jgi:hypothetical protein
LWAFGVFGNRAGSKQRWGKIVDVELLKNYEGDHFEHWRAFARQTVSVEFA